MALLAVTFAALAVSAAAIDFSSDGGRVPPLNEAGQPPMPLGEIGWGPKMFHYLPEAGIRHSRLHDTGGPYGGGKFVDISNLFRDFKADENDPKSYDFTFTDELLKAMVTNGIAPFFRLGETIENHAHIRRYRTFVPPDKAKWARICEHVIRHYNEGWANGFRFGIEYWEIWNEPDFTTESWNSMWSGTAEDFYDLYEVTAKHLKKCFPHLKIGGYGSCGFWAITSEERAKREGKDARTAERKAQEEYHVSFFRNFLKRVKERKIPFDFFTFHSYSPVGDILRQVEWCCDTMKAEGFEDVELNLDEWLPAPALEKLGTARQAAEIAAVLAGATKTRLGRSMIYDARCGIGNYSPLFNPMTYKPHKAYYALVAFDELRKLGRKASVPETPEGVYVAAATDGGTNAAVLVANVSGKAWHIDLAFGDWEIVTTCVIDARRTYESAAWSGEAANDTVWLLKLHKRAENAPCAPALPSAAGEPVKIVCARRTMPTYPYGDPDPVATTDPGLYPYFRYDGQSATSRTQAWDVVRLSNGRIEVEMFPEIGGKVWGAKDLVTGRHFVYANDAVKFRDIALRGPWCSGGIEFNFGITGHAQWTVAPVDWTTRRNADGSASFFAGGYEFVTRTFWQVEVLLRPGEDFFTTRLTWHNGGGQPVTRYQWSNSAVSARGKPEMVYPGAHQINHDGTAHPWPRDEKGVYRAAFANDADLEAVSWHVIDGDNRFFGAWWADWNFGMWHRNAAEDKFGRKIFMWSQARSGGIWEDLLTDRAGQYIELQSGRGLQQQVEECAATPFKFQTLVPGATDVFEERWGCARDRAVYEAAKKFPSAEVARPMAMPKDFDAKGAYALYRAGEQKMRAGLHVAEAAKLLEEALAKDPCLVPALGELASFELRRGNVAQAAALAGKALAVDAYDGPANFISGEIALDANLLNRARDRFGVASLDAAYRPAALVRLGMIAIREHDYAVAAGCARKALECSAYDPEAHQLAAIAARLDGDPGGHFNAAEKGLVRTPIHYGLRYEHGEKPEALAQGELPGPTLVELGLWYAKAGLDGDARRIWAAAKSPVAKLLAGDLAGAAAMPVEGVFPHGRETIAALEKAVAQNGSWKFKYYLAIALAPYGEMERAKTLLEACGEVPDAAVFYLTRATCREGKTALADLTRAEKLGDSWRVGRAFVKAHLKAVNPEAAIAVANAYRAKYPGLQQLDSAAVEALIAAKRYAEAVAVLEKIRVLPSEFNKAIPQQWNLCHRELAKAALMKGDKEEALRHREAVMAFPENLGAGRPVEPEKVLKDWPAIARERLVAIGFDDFRASDFVLVAPLFEKYGAHATFNRPAWRADWSADDIGKMRRLEQAGHEIGDHTWFHWNVPFDDPLMNGQDPAHPDGDQTPFPSNAQMRGDRGDGKNAFGFPLTDSVDVQLSDFFDYGRERWSAFAAPWGQLTDAQCQKIRDYFAVYGNPNGYLDVLDTLSNRHLGTQGHSRGSWDAGKGCYTGGVFTGCRTSANHEIWERILALTKAAYRAQYRKDFAFATWSWPGSIPSPFLFRKDGCKYHDEACTLPANALARFPSTRAAGAPKPRSWTEALRAAGYVTTHDMTHPGRRDGTELTMMRREMFHGARHSRRDALAYSTGRTVSYSRIPREYPETFFKDGLDRAAEDMYDAGGSFRDFVEAVRHETASGRVHGEVIDSENTFSERMFLDRALAFCRATGVRVVSRREAFTACFATNDVPENLMPNPTFRNTAAEFMPQARRLPKNPDGYLGACHVTALPDGARALVTDGPVTNLVYGVPPGKLTFSVRAKGRGEIRIFLVRNRSPLSLGGLEELSSVSVNGTSFAPVVANLSVPDAPETPYEPRWEGLGDKVMALVIVHDAGLTLYGLRLE